MPLTDKNLEYTEPYFRGGYQYVYQVGDYRFSVVPRMWSLYVNSGLEIAVMRKDEFGKYRIVYDTPLTSDVEVFMSDDETNEFLEKCFDYALNGEKKSDLPAHLL